MKYVELRGGGSEEPVLADPRPYLARLPGIAAGLPPGARAFATDPAHYDPDAKRCVRDLLPTRVNRTADGDVEIRFRHNCFRHEEDLLVRYTGVSRFQSDVLDVCDPASLGDVILDEILPLPGGCTHEVACRPGRLVVACRDLVAEWIPAACPDTGADEGA
ncbi:hypothetical protein [Streptomyces sp. NPDC004286]|uniref:hypothetical protein n=1 Tax=Streptomyces sp. NPDC004286 TaxID=3364696 RepID=UPI00368045FE